MSAQLHSTQATVVGAGPVGCVLAMLLVRHGFDVRMYEMRPDMRTSELDGGRSINLVLTDRGLRALEMFGLRDKVLEITVPVLGRMLHALDGETSFQPYGKDESECNYSVSRGKLNEFLLDAAEDAGVTIAFEKTCIGANFEAGQLDVADADGNVTTVDAGVIFGADGAPSAVRQALVDAGIVDERVDMLEHGYKELPFPSGEDGKYAMAGHALHIWPRGDHFLMGLANLDGSFTGTIYLPWKGVHGFDELDERAHVRQFFEEDYPDAIPLLDDDFEAEFLANPNGKLGTVRCAPWHLDDRVLLVGDAAHGIVPFFGQGLNCGFEDCVVLDELMAASDDLAEVFAAFDARRKPNTEAIADMALDNFDEMREKVADPEFLLAKAVEHRIEQEMPEIYRSRYAIVMYSDLPFRFAFEVGEVQEAILAELTVAIERADQADLERARELIEARLVPLYERHRVSLTF